MIYRVTIKTTGSLQPSGTFWEREVAYCGTDLEEARVAYLREEVKDYWHGYGNRARETTIRQFESTPEDIDDRTADEITE
jgi:hypothetical protein